MTDRAKQEWPSEYVIEVNEDAITRYDNETLTDYVCAVVDHANLLFLRAVCGR